MESARRIHEAIESSGHTRQSLAKWLDVSIATIDRISGRDARTNQDAYRPVPPGDVMAEIAIQTDTDFFYLMDYTDLIHPLVTQYKRQISSLVDLLSKDIMKQATLRCAQQGRKIQLEDVLEWYRVSGGVVGQGHPVEEYVDIVEIPDAGAKIVKPIKVGAQSKAGGIFGSTERFWRELQTWPEEKNQEIVGHFRRVIGLKYGDDIPLTPMEVLLSGQTEPTHYHRICMEAKLLGRNAPSVAISYAF
ncbi:MAG: hypothetical protein AAGC82_10120 [Pseudomonadota bacterium]